MATQSHPQGPRLRGSLVVVPLVAAVTVLGVWITGGLISDDFKISMALTAAWFATVGGVILLTTRGRRALRVAALGAYLATAAVVGGYLFYTTVHDRVVDEQVVVAAPGSASGGNVLRASGSFSSLAHDAAGDARLVQLPGGERRLTLTNFETAAGPDLRVYLVAGRPSDGNGQSKDLGRLKGNIGNQQYDVPRDIDVARYSTVVIWCRAFSVAFGQAPLKAA